MIIKKNVEKISKDIIEKYKKVETATIGHILNFGFMSSSIKPASEDIKIVGIAVTLKIPSMDSALCHKIIGMAGEGNIIVIDRGKDTEHACWGGVTTLAAKIRKISGVIIDGAVTDILEIKEQKFPVFYKTISALTTKKLAIDGEINVPIQCGGVVVNPGDLIVGDANGIVVISPRDSISILKKAIEKERMEIEIVKRLEKGEPLAKISGVDDLIKQKLNDEKKIR